jgi:hypothetical protein
MVARRIAPILDLVDRTYDVAENIITGDNLLRATKKRGLSIGPVQIVLSLLTKGCKTFRAIRAVVLEGFRELYATGRDIDAFVALMKAKSVDLFAQLRFTEEDVREVRAEFLGRSQYDDGSLDGNPNEIYVPPEGKVILLFTKPAH